MSAEQLHPVAIEARNGYRLWVRFDDGAEGEIDLSERAGRGVFKIWNQRGVFESATISPHRTIRWSGDAELCADALYAEVTGCAPEEIMPGLRGRVRLLPIVRLWVGGEGDCADEVCG
ncbi:DUF2442 domain-containing protein [Candidatus Poriferisodalis sp.]|uniref:DUF2442 domain-containing protein n=1 Tax=Candidatus Poriferisodalis sp. TaxID=3101277 RepID=UPI003B516885